MLHYQLNNATATQNENNSFYKTGSASATQNENNSFYTDDFSSTELIVNRTDSNMLNFELTFGDDFDLIEIVNHKLYHHKINETETMKFKNNSDFHD
jgi:hypothetical protein